MLCTCRLMELGLLTDPPCSQGKWEWGEALPPPPTLVPFTCSSNSPKHLGFCYNLPTPPQECFVSSTKTKNLASKPPCAEFPP